MRGVEDYFEAGIATTKTLIIFSKFSSIKRNVISCDVFTFGETDTNQKLHHYSALASASRRYNISPLLTEVIIHWFYLGSFVHQLWLSIS